MRINPAALLLTACAAAPASITPEPSRPGNPGSQDAGVVAESQPLQEEPEPYVPAPWTEAFLSPAVLMADSIRIEGPPGLFEHAVTRADDALFLRKVETISEGRLQTVRPRPDSPQLEVVRAQLDTWQLAAFREVVFLERLDPALPVRVVATGDAVWRDTDGKERRDIRLVFIGELTSDQ